MYKYLQQLDSTLCTVTCSNWTVPYVQLPAATGQYLVYSYLQHLDSTFGRQIAVHVCNYKKES